MVKVECDGCKAPYEIDERRIPATGLKMRCPKCGTSVLVAKPGGALPAPGAPPAAPPRPAAPRPGPPPKPAAPAAPTPGFGALDPFGEDDAGGGGSVDLPAAVTGPAFGGAAPGAVDLPAPVAPRAPAPPPARPAPPPAAGGFGGFGEIDLMVEGGGAGGGEVDLPVVPAHAGGGGFGAVDLPAARPQAPPFGAQPFGAPAGGGDSIDLPVVSGADAGRGFPGGRVPPPPPRGGATIQGVGLPAPFQGGAGLPTPAGGGPGLPMALGQGSAGLPAVAGAGLPSASHGDLPAIGGGLPVVGANLPAIGGGLPAIGGGLPAVGGGLPMAAGGGLPSVGGGLPAIGGGLPMTGGGLPGLSSGSLPAVGGGLPVVGGQMPMTAGAGMPVPQMGALPSAQGASLPSIGDGFPSPLDPGFPSLDGGGPAHFGEHAAGGVDLNSVNLAGSVGGEVELDGALPGAGGMAGGIGAPVDLDTSLPKPRSRAREESVRPGRTLHIGRYLIGTVAVLAIGGALMGISPRLGVYGTHFISDRMNASKHDSALAALRKEEQATLDADTVSAHVAMIEKAKTAHEAAPRHDDTTAYASYVVYMKSVRFGRDAANEARAKGWVDGMDPAKTGPSQQLVRAAQAALAGQFDQARQAVAAVIAKTPDDVDALVLAGEIELLAKTPDKALEVFTKAVTAHKSARTLYGLARAQMSSGKSSEAEATAKSVLEASPNHAGARVMLATIAGTTSSRQAEAIDLLKKVVDDPDGRKEASDPDLVAAYTQLGRLYLAGSHLSQAEDAYAQALKLDPQAVDGLIGNGELFYRAGRYSEAEARFSSAISADGANLEAKIGKAKTFIALEKAPDAKELLKGIAASNPKDPRVYYWLGRAQEILDEKKDAEASYRKSIEIAGKSEAGVPAYVGLSHLLASQGQAEDAKKSLAEASEKYPNSAELSKARGDIALQTGRFEEARDQFEKALKISANDVDTLFKLGQTYRHLKAYDEAAAIYDKVATTDKDYPGLALERGLYFQETGKLDEALKMYDAALKKAPDDVDLKLRIGSSQVIAGHPKEAIPTLKEVLKQKPNSAEANHFLGRAMLLGGESLADAERYIDRAADLDPKNAEYQLYVGWAANEAGQPQKAEPALNKALELDTSLADAYWQIGVLMRKQGRTDDAIKQLNTAIEKKPSRYEAWATLALCYEDKSLWQYAETSWLAALKGDDKNAEWHYQLGTMYERQNNQKGTVKELERAVELVGADDKGAQLGWLSKAHRLLGEAFRATDKKKALEHFKAYKKLAPGDDAYQSEADQAIAQLSQ